jgi:hypothetical protein
LLYLGFEIVHRIGGIHSRGYEEFCSKGSGVWEEHVVTCYPLRDGFLCALFTDPEDRGIVLL